MKPLPTLNQDTVIELAREGGFAYIPKLAGQRRIALADITPEQRQRLNQLLNQTLPYAQEEGQPNSPRLRRPALLPRTDQLHQPHPEHRDRAVNPGKQRAAGAGGFVENRPGG